MASLPDYPAKGDRKRLDQEWLRTLHRQGIASFLIDGPPDGPGTPDKLRQAIAEFNQGQYWHCHETLEALWLPERYPLRLFYHGLIKAAVGLLHLQRRNRPGALAKLGDAAFALAPFSPLFLGVDTASPIRDIELRLECLRSGSDANWPAIENLPGIKLRMLEGAG